MGSGVPEARRQCYNSPMNSDLSGTRTTRTRPRMPFLGRTLDRGPTNIKTVELYFTYLTPTLHLLTNFTNILQKENICTCFRTAQTNVHKITSCSLKLSRPMVAACLFRLCATMASSPFPPGAARPSTPCEVRVRRPFSHVGNLSKTSSLPFCQFFDSSDGFSWSVLSNFGHRLISVLG